MPKAITFVGNLTVRMMLLMIWFLTETSFAQQILWEKTYDQGNREDEAYSVNENQDKGFIIAGRSYNSVVDQGLLLRTNENGDILWIKTYGGISYNYRSRFYSVKQTPNGGFISTGFTNSSGAGGYDVWLVRTDGNGNELWTKTFGGSSYDWGRCVQNTQQGGFVVAGSTQSSGAGAQDVWLILTDQNGDKIWSKTFGGTGDDYANYVQQTTDGGFILTGTTRSFGGGGAYIWLIRTDADGNILWTKTHGTGGDYGYVGESTMDGGFIVAAIAGGDAKIIRTDQNGDALFTRSFGYTVTDPCVQQTRDGGFIVTRTFSDKFDYIPECIKTNENGDIVWTKTLGVESEDKYVYFVRQTTDCGFILTGYHWESGYTEDVWLVKLRPPFSLLLKDSHDNPIPQGKAFRIYKVHNDPPTITEEYKGESTTDAQGKITLPGNWGLSGGDSIKVERLLYTEPARKHTNILRNMYYIKVDNTKLKTDGTVFYDTLYRDPCQQQELIVDHTTVMFDLLVSVEWDADQQYLESLLEGFRYMSNYWYDVSDGQLYLDTVRIYDNNVNWDQADVRIYTSNMVRPGVNPYLTGDIRLGGAIHSAGNDRLHFPRIFYFNNEDANRNLTYTIFPYNWTIDQTTYYGHNVSYPPSRTLAHEFGHYGIGFLDEYCHCPCYPEDEIFPDYYFGLMDQNLIPDQPQNSEMSCAGMQYSEASNQVTCQWTERGDRSCWDYFKWDFEGTYDGLFAPVKIPMTEMFWGPNDNLQDLDYDVGGLIPDATTAVVNYDGGATHVRMRAFDPMGVPLPKTDGLLLKTDRDIYQGQTADDGRLLFLGANYGDGVYENAVWVEEPKGTVRWLYGQGVIGKSGVSNFHNAYRTSWAGDSLDLFLKAVEGDYPLLYSTFLSTGTPEYVLTASNMFSSNPTVELHPDEGTTHSYALQSTPTGYSVVIPDDMGSSGRLTLLAVDDSASTFFVHTAYCLTEIVDTAFARVVRDLQGGCELYLDTLNSSLEKVLILSSPYPPIRTGLDPLSEQAGEIYSLSSYPSVALLGSNRIVIHYADSDVDSQFEATLEIFKWNENLQKWQELCGFIDTDNNIVGASINSLGIYGAFTTGYLRGDANGSGLIELGDVVYLITYLYKNGPAPNPLLAGDANCSGEVELGDVVYLITYLYKAGPPPSCK